MINLVTVVLSLKDNVKKDTLELIKRKILKLEFKVDKNKDIKNIFENGEWYHSVLFNTYKSKGTFDYTKLLLKS